MEMLDYAILTNIKVLKYEKIYCLFQGQFSKAEVLIPFGEINYAFNIMPEMFFLDANYSKN